MKMKTIKFATSNPNKVVEGNIVGKEFGIEFVQIMEDYPEIRDEDVARVAEEGAKFVYGSVKEPIIVEDTGLFINALNGFPGTYSKFVFRKIGNDGILRLMKGMDSGAEQGNRRAVFVSAIGYYDGDRVIVFKGEVNGRITSEPKGNVGFGYDPIFMPDDYDKTFAENRELKLEISHRRNSFQKFCEDTL